MTELFLNRQRVVLPPNLKIKIVFENPYFTKSSTYTHNIPLPMQGCPVNQKIFRHINRNDVSKRYETFEARLVSDNQPLIVGTAVILEISEKEVQIQILSGNSELNFFQRSEKAYIDELKLGYNTNNPGRNSPMDSSNYWKAYPTASVVWFPVYNESAGEIYNRLAANYVQESGKDVESTSFYGATYNKWCLQPYLCHIIKIVIEAIGYKLKSNQLAETIFKNLFICNATATYVYTAILPHWTVNEFLEQIENAFGLITVVEEQTKSINLRLASQYFKDAKKEYLDVLDEFTCKVEEEDTTALNNANIGFALSGSETHALKKVAMDVLKSVTRKQYQLLAELKAAYNAMDDYNRRRTIFETGGRMYIHYEDESYTGLKEVNQYGDLKRNPEQEDPDIELKIVPVGMREETAEVYGKGSVFDGNKLWSASVQMPSMEGVVYEDVAGEDGSVQAMIDGSTEVNRSKPDILQVAFNDGSFRVMTSPDRKNTHRYPIPWVDYSDDITGINYNFQKWSMRLNDFDEIKHLGNQIFEEFNDINTTVEEKKRFYSQKIHDPKNIFVCNNKEYVCVKIEMEVTATEINPIQEATLYELLG